MVVVRIYQMVINEWKKAPKRSPDFEKFYKYYAPTYIDGLTRLLKNCVACGCEDRTVLVIHHQPVKHETVAIFGKQIVNVAKHEVPLTLCANCHLKLHKGVLEQQKLTRIKDAVSCIPAW